MNALISRASFVKRSCIASYISALSLTLVAISATSAYGQSSPVQNSGQNPGQNSGANSGSTAAAPTSAWPQTATQGADTITIYEPQFDSLSGTTLTMSAAVTITRGDSSGAPMNGVAAVSGNVSPADVAGELEINALTVTSVTFGTTADASAAQLLGTAIAGLAFTVDRETLVEDMKMTNARAAGTPGLSFALPRFVSSTVPAVLINIDGAPIQTPLSTTGWTQVKNTPFVVLVSPTGQWFVWLGDRNASNAWMSASSMTADFTAAAAPSSDVIAALGTPANTPSSSGSNSSRAESTTPPSRVIISTTPAVLIATNGPAKLTDIGNGISEVTNSNCVLLYTASPSEWWTLQSGRWFHAGVGAAWQYADPSEVPASFQNLPATGRLKSARASVVGTTEATAATVAAREVRTVTVKMDAPCTVTYNGAANFTSVGDGADAGVGYATNASQPVFGVGNQYFCCNSGAWFVSSQPEGPWAVTDTVPAAIYSIPPSCPDYPATYVEVYGSEKDPTTGALTSVTFGFTSGYLGTYLNGGTPVYGTGYNYASAQPTAATAANYQATPQTYSTDSSYDNQSGTYAPSTAYNDYDYMQPTVDPYYLDNGWGGWGCCSDWSSGWGWGYNNWNRWGSWNHAWNNWNPYSNPARDNDWENNNRNYANGRADNALNRAPANSAWNQSSDWKNWNARQTGFPESNDWKNWNANPATKNEGADWQKWNAAASAGDEPQNQRPADQPANLNRNGEYNNGSNAAEANHWAGQTNQEPANLNGNRNGGASPRTGVSGFHPSYNQNYRPSSGGRGASPAYHGGGARGGGGRR